MNQRNIIGRILFYSGIATIIIGTITGIYNSYHIYSDGFGIEQYEFDWRSLIYFIPTAFFNGLILIGISELIHLLDSINRRKLPAIVAGDNQEKNKETSLDNTEEKQEDWKLNIQEEEKIYEMFADMAILEILPYVVKGYCIVKLQEYDGPLKPFVKVIDLNGGDPQEVENVEIRKKIIGWYNEQR